MHATLRDPIDDAELDTPVAAANRLGVSRRTIYYWMAAGRVRVRYAPNGNALVEVASLITQKTPLPAGGPTSTEQASNAA